MDFSDWSSVYDAYRDEDNDAKPVWRAVLRVEMDRRCLDDALALVERSLRASTHANYTANSCGTRGDRSRAFDYDSMSDLVRAEFLASVRKKLRK